MQRLNGLNLMHGGRGIYGEERIEVSEHDRIFFYKNEQIDWENL